MTIQAQAQIAKSQESLTTAVMLDKHPEVLRTYLFKLQEEDHDTYHEASLEICRILLVKIRDRDSNFNDLLEMLSSAIDVRAIELLLTPQSIIELDLTDCVKDYTQHLESILYSDLSDNAFLISWNVINKKILETKYSSSDWTIDDRLANFMINQFVCLFISDSRDKIEQFKIIAKIILCCPDQSVQMKRLEILLGKSAQAIEQMKPTILFTKQKTIQRFDEFFSSVLDEPGHSNELRNKAKEFLKTLEPVIANKEKEIFNILFCEFQSNLMNHLEEKNKNYCIEYQHAKLVCSSVPWSFMLFCLFKLIKKLFHLTLELFSNSNSSFFMMKLKKILTKFKRLVSQNINNPYPLFFDEDLTLKDDLADVAKKFIEKTQDTTDDLEAFCHLKRDVKEFFYQRRLFYSPKVDLENHELAHRLKELVLFKKTISH